METQEELRRAQGRDLQKQLEDEIRQLRQYLENIHPVIEREYPVALQRIQHLEQVIQDLEQQPAKVLKDPEQQQRIKDLEEELEELKRRPPPPPMVTKDPSDEEHIKSLQEELNHVKGLLKSTESVAEKNPQTEEEIKQLRGAISELQGILRGRSEITVKGEEEIREYIQGLQQEIERLRTEGVYEFQTGPSEEGLVVAKRKRKPHQKGVKDFDWKKERKDVTKELIERSREERKAKSRKLFEAQVTQQDEKGPSEREIRQQESFNELIQLRDQYPDRIDYTTLSLPELDNYMRGIDNYRGKILTHLNRFGEDEQLRRVSNEIGPYLVEMNTYKRQLQQPPKPRSRTPSPPKTIATTTPPPPPRPRSKSPSQQSRTPVFTASPPPPPPQPPTQPSPSFTQQEIDLARQLWEISRTGSTSEQDDAIKQMRKILKEKKAEGQKARNDKIRGYFQRYYGKDILDDPPERGRRGG
jgi:soluble cytochrome b562